MTGITLTGEIRKIRFQDESGYVVFEVDTDGPEDFAGSSVTAAGSLVGAAEGLSVRLSGEFRNHPRFGRQFRFSAGMVRPPETGVGLRAFLASGRVEGIGPVLAGRLADHFGDNLRQALDSGADVLAGCPGIGPARAASISNAWRSASGIREAVVALCEMGLSPARAARIVSFWGEAAPAKVAADPYELEVRLRGFGFRSADLVASAVGVAKNSPVRLKAAIRHALSEAEDSGHLFVADAILSGLASSVSGVPAEQFAPLIDQMISSGLLVSESVEHGRILYLPDNYAAEAGSADAIGRLSGVAPRRSVDVSSVRSGLAPSQVKALEIVGAAPVSVLTGGPGTGKTTVTAEIVAMCVRSGLKAALAAPTGRAAMRLREASGHEAVTLHRLLEFNPGDGSFGRNAGNPIEADWVLVDESSMIDMRMFSSLVAAVHPGCRLTFIGDADQLPPVGAGDPFRDLIRSAAVPVARLTQVFRQGEGSSITAAAHMVIKGEMPDSDRSSDTNPGEFHVVFRESPEEAAEMAATLVCDRIPARFGLDPRREIQVLAPMKKGVCGTDSLNDILRAKLGFPLSRGMPARGERVMQTRNNYDLDVYNGDIGIVESVSDADSGPPGVVVRFDGREVAYGAEDVDDLCPAAAVTIHKAQGSEFPAVVVCLHNQHFIMLRRKLLYTAITRGRRVVVVVASRRSLDAAVRNALEEPRNTMFARRLTGWSGRPSGADGITDAVHPRGAPAI